MKKFAVEVTKELKDGFESYGFEDMTIYDDLQDAVDKAYHLVKHYRHFNKKDTYTMYVHTIKIEEDARLGDFEIIKTVLTKSTDMTAEELEASIINGLVDEAVENVDRTKVWLSEKQELEYGASLPLTEAVAIAMDSQQLLPDDAYDELFDKVSELTYEAIRKELLSNENYNR